MTNPPSYINPLPAKVTFIIHLKTTQHSFKHEKHIMIVIGNSRHHPTSRIPLPKRSFQCLKSSRPSPSNLLKDHDIDETLTPLFHAHLPNPTSLTPTPKTLRVHIPVAHDVLPYTAPIALLLETASAWYVVRGWVVLAGRGDEGTVCWVKVGECREVKVPTLDIEFREDVREAAGRVRDVLKFGAVVVRTSIIDVITREWGIYRSAS
ncbi:hypothetical protein BC829DRAFT_47590 [Chytridium lagenaria]|nr:hypothetical protein BC829DRAFT_47590 [Chytridium lagenaria]